MHVSHRLRSLRAQCQLSTHCGHRPYPTSSSLLGEEGGVSTLLIMFLSVALFADRAPSVVTPATVGRMIDRYGAKQTVHKLSNAVPNDTHTDFGDFDKVLDGIASGDAHWLRLVPRLAPGTD